jgi:F-type H+-transporting ATPase subunit b
LLIDWFTVGAQALNFVVLVWLMKRFLYEPILHAIAAREATIAKRLSDADAKQAEASKEQDEFRRKNEAFEQERADLVSRATADANAERKRLLDAARQAADVLTAKRQKLLLSDAENLKKALRQKAQNEVFAIARKALTELAGSSLEARISEVFARRLRDLSPEAKASLGEALTKGGEPALVQSAFELPGEQRATIQNAVNETFSADVPLRFEAAPALVSGIALTVNGQKLAWSIADYLSSLEVSVEQLQQRSLTPRAAE